MDAPTPLQVQPTIKDGEQYLKMWVGGTTPLLVKSPLNPYLDSKNELQDIRIIKNTLGKYRLMSDNQYHELYKLEFNTIKDCDEFAVEYSNDCIDIRVTERFTDAIVQHYPNFFKQYPSKGLNVLVFDIEQATDGTKFPTANEACISIAWAWNDEPEQQMFSNGHDDNKLLITFAKMLSDKKPDIIVGYNHTKYDIPRLIEKFDLLGVPNYIWGKEDRAPFTYSKTIGPTELVCMNAPGTIFFDVFHSIMIDLTLSGHKRGLKSVAKHYAKDLGIKEVIEVDTSNTIPLIGTPELRKYNICDVTNTRILFNFYFQNILAMAEFVGAPLHRLVPLAMTYGFTQILGNIFQKTNIIQDSSNGERYKWAYENLGTYLDEEGEEQIQRPYQGAISKCIHPGYYKDVIEADVNSLYPSIMSALGIGPDNVRVLSTEPISPFKVIRIGQKRIYKVPDTMRNFTWVIEVNGTSQVAAVIDQYLIERLRIKNLSKTEVSAALFAIAYAMKTNLNAAYGLFGSENGEFGELGVAVLTTICGRMVIEESIRFIGEPNSLLVDTDSNKFEKSKGKTQQELNEHFSKWIQEVWLGKSKITWDLKSIEAALFIQDKTYLILVKNKKTGELEMEKTGGAFKGTRYSNIFNKVINDVGLIYLKDGPEAAHKAGRKWINLDSFPQEDFVMDIRVGKPVNEYKNKNATAPAMAQRAKEVLGIEPYVGQTISFVKTKNGYDLPTKESLNSLDTKYYLQIVRDALGRMKLDDVISDNEFEYLTIDKKQMRLAQWL